MPTADAYGGETVRDRLVRQFGEATVTRAETAALANILIRLNIISKNDWTDMVEYACKKADERRRRQAGLE
jgi:hypothetical protein